MSISSNSAGEKWFSIQKGVEVVHWFAPKASVWESIAKQNFTVAEKIVSAVKNYLSRSLRRGHSKKPLACGVLYNLSMPIPDRIITELELRRNMGERGARKFIAYKGIVYDVTDCPKWKNDMHELLHFPGQDLTSELPDAPHKEEVFNHDCVKIVGRLESNQIQ